MAWSPSVRSPALSVVNASLPKAVVTVGDCRRMRLPGVKSPCEKSFTRVRSQRAWRRRRVRMIDLPGMISDSSGPHAIGMPPAGVSEDGPQETVTDPIRDSSAPSGRAAVMSPQFTTA